VAFIPPPPQIKLSHSPDERVALLLRAYNLVLQREQPNVWNLYRKTPLRAPERAQLVVAADELRYHQVPPIRWVEFSLERWNRMRNEAKASGKKGKQLPPERPPLKYVFSKNRLDSTAGWALQDMMPQGGTVVCTRAHRTLLARWQQMHWAVTTYRVSAAEAEETFFPNGLYKRLVAQTQSETKTIQADLDRRLDAGEYLWDGKLFFDNRLFNSNARQQRSARK
jgi:hypothetical protein